MPCRPGSTSTRGVPQIRDPTRWRGFWPRRERDPPNPGNANERLPDEGNADRLAEFLAGDAPTVVYFGKLIQNKGVQVLIDALRERRCPSGDRRLRPLPAELERAAEGLRRALHRAARAPPPRAPTALADAAVVPSIFPEAFGMVAAEAAAAGCPPVVAHHSGLAEIAQGLERLLPAGHGGLASFPSGDAAGSPSG